MSSPLKATIGVSGHPDSMRAGREAAEEAVAQCSTVRARLALVFASSWFDQAQLLAGIRSVLGDIPLAGESTAGEIGPKGPSTHSCVVVLLTSDLKLWSVGSGEGLDHRPREAGQQAAYNALQGFTATQRSGCLIFADGLATSSSDMLRGMQEVLGTGAMIAGGLAGDDLRYTRTYQYAGSRVLTRSVVGVLFGAPIRMATGIGHGFAPISRPRRITRAKANILYELDGRPAAAVYDEYFGTAWTAHVHDTGLTRQRIAYPLGLQSDRQDQWLLRNVLAVGGDGSLACSADVQDHTWLQLMIGSRELALEAAGQAAKAALWSLNHPACLLVFDSSSRRQLLGSQHAARDLSQIREVVGPAVPIAGGYTYGEQAPTTSQAAGAVARTTVQTSSILVVALGS